MRASTPGALCFLVVSHQGPWCHGGLMRSGEQEAQVVLRESRQGLHVAAHRPLKDERLLVLQLQDALLRVRRRVGRACA